MYKVNNAFKLIIAIAVSELAGVIGSVFTMPSIAGWYAGLVKPALNPPAWVFGPVWTVLFALMGISLFLIWSFDFTQDKKQHPYKLENIRMLRMRKIGIMVFFVQLILNILWSIIFFGLHSPSGALVEIVFLWLAILATIIAFYTISRPAAWLLAPYLAWVSFASYINYAVWSLN